MIIKLQPCLNSVFKLRQACGPYVFSQSNPWLSTVALEQHKMPHSLGYCKRQDLLLQEKGGAQNAEGSVKGANSRRSLLFMCNIGS